MTRQLFMRGLRKTETTEGWKRVDKVKWENVPAKVNTFLNTVRKTNSRSSYASKETEEEYLTRFHKHLLEECNNKIEIANSIIENGEAYLIDYQASGRPITNHPQNSYSSYYDDQVYKVSQDDFTTYRYFWGSRGRGATYRSNFSVLRKDLSDCILFTKIDTSLEEKLSKETYEQDYTATLSRIMTRCDRVRKDLDRRMSKEVIINKAQKTMYDLARGNGTSTLGAFSFDMNAHTYYIDQDTGRVKNWYREQYYNFSSVLPLKPEHKKILDEWEDKINDMTQQLYDASLDWYEVMSNIQDTLAEQLLETLATQER